MGCEIGTVIGIVLVVIAACIVGFFFGYLICDREHEKLQ